MTDEPTPTSSDDTTTDDTEAHAIRSGRGPAATPAVEAHSMRGKVLNEDVPEGVQATEREAGQDDGPDVEGHFARGRA